MIRINWNGSRMLGQKPASLEALLELLTLERISPEPVLLVGTPDPQGGRIYAGNFERISHAFSVTTDEDYVAGLLISAIRASQELPSLPAPGLSPVTDRAWQLMRDGIAV